MDQGEDRRRRFEALYDAHVGLVLGYARRRAAPDAAQDVVAETFLVAWRRLDAVPADAAPWLLAVARRQLANLHRAERRRAALLERVRAESPLFAPEHDIDQPDPEVVAALARLSASDRELLRLLAWERLDHAEAAAALGVTRAVLRLRLHRARRRLCAELERAETETAGAEGAPARGEPAVRPGAQS